jgi:hypothetical protein
LKAHILEHKFLEDSTRLLDDLQKGKVNTVGSSKIQSTDRHGVWMKGSVYLLQDYSQGAKTRPPTFIIEAITDKALIKEMVAV